MDDAVLILECAFDQKKPAAGNNQPIAVIKIWCNDHIGDACLVFHRDKDKAFGYAWPLPRYDAAGSSDIFSISAFLQLFSGPDAPAP